MNKSLSGLLIYTDLSEYNSLDFTKIEFQDYYLTNLTGGHINNIKNESNKAVIFDFDKGEHDYHPGFVRGRIYPDNKFIAKANYKAGTGIPEEVLNGTTKYIKGGIEIKGIWYEHDGKKTGFYLFLTKDGVLPGKKQAKRPTYKKKSVRRKKRNDTVSEILNKELLQIVTEKARRIGGKNNKLIYDQYGHIIRLNLRPENRDNMVIAISLAYSWMPTMLDIFATSEKEIDNLLLATKRLGRIRNIDDLDIHENEITEDLIVLTKAINHSIVGVSKTLNIFFPERIPIIDSNVLKSWNSTFRKHFKKYPELKLPVNTPYDIERAVSAYIRYWRLLLSWQYNTAVTSLRQLEESFYLIGKKTQTK